MPQAVRHQQNRRSRSAENGREMSPGKHISQNLDFAAGGHRMIGVRPRSPGDRPYTTFRDAIRTERQAAPADRQRHHLRGRKARPAAQTNRPSTASRDLAANITPRPPRASTQNRPARPQAHRPATRTSCRRISPHRERYRARANTARTASATAAAVKPYSSCKNAAGPTWPNRSLTPWRTSGIPAPASASTAATASPKPPTTP